MTNRDDYDPAVLMCEGCEEPTRHSYKGGRPRVTASGETSGIETIYACRDCGRGRVWGFEDVRLFRANGVAAA